MYTARSQIRTLRHVRSNPPTERNPPQSRVAAPRIHPIPRIQLGENVNRRFKVALIGAGAVATIALATGGTAYAVAKSNLTGVQSNGTIVVCVKDSTHVYYAMTGSKCAISAWACRASHCNVRSSPGWSNPASARSISPHKRPKPATTVRLKWSRCVRD